MLRHDVAATCVLKMPLNPNHPSYHPLPCVEFHKINFMEFISDMKNLAVDFVDKFINI